MHHKIGNIIFISICFFYSSLSFAFIYNSPIWNHNQPQTKSTTTSKNQDDKKIIKQLFTKSKYSDFKKQDSVAPFTIPSGDK
jgi:hypothetical protein